MKLAGLQSGILGVYGPFGSGKTYWVVREVYKGRRLGSTREVFCNFEAWFPWGPRPHIFDRVEDVLGLEHCVVVLDEAHVCFGSYEYKKNLTEEFLSWFGQLRKFDVLFCWITHRLNDVHVMARDRTQLFIRTQSFYKLGFFFAWTTDDPRAQAKSDRGEKAGALPMFYGFNPLIAGCYDTYGVARTTRKEAVLNAVDV